MSDKIYSCYINEISIPGYSMYHNIECKKEHGVVIYVNKDLESSEIEVSNSGPEYVLVKVLLNNGKVLLYVICIEALTVHELMTK